MFLLTSVIVEFLYTETYILDISRNTVFLQLFNFESYPFGGLPRSRMMKVSLGLWNLFESPEITSIPRFHHCKNVSCINLQLCQDTFLSCASFTNSWYLSSAAWTSLGANNTNDSILKSWVIFLQTQSSPGIDITWFLDDCAWIYCIGDLSNLSPKQSWHYRSWG